MNDPNLPRRKALYECAVWLETLASPTLHNDPFTLAADWAANLVREYAEANYGDTCSGCSMPAGRHWDTCPNRWDGRPTR